MRFVAFPDVMSGHAIANRLLRVSHPKLLGKLKGQGVCHRLLY